MAGYRKEKKVKCVNKKCNDLKPEIDNYVDAAGYIGLAADMLEGK